MIYSLINAEFMICGVSKRTKELRTLISLTEPHINPDHLVMTQCMNIYAEKVDTPLFGRKGSVVIYVNTERRLRDTMSRNCLIYHISDKFTELQKVCKNMQENEVIKRIKKFLTKSTSKYFEYSICESQEGIVLEWKTNTETRIEDERLDGKYILYASDPTLSAEDVVRLYFERDYVEKVFRDLKTFEEIAPIRHRKESRVLGIIFVCTLALRFKIALRTMLTKAKNAKLTADILLKQLGRVNQVDFQMDKELQIWYVGLQKKTEKVLDEIEMKGLFGDRIKYS